MPGPVLVADLAVVLGVAAVTSVVARTLKQPTILGHLAAGLIVGPYLPIPVFADPQRVATLAELGVILVMFAIGLEFRIQKMLAILPRSGLTATIQVSALWCTGFFLARALGWDVVGASFLGACLAISSTMVVSKVFETQPVEQGVRERVLGILVLQDVVAIVLVAVMTAVAAGGTLSALDLAQLIGKLVAVLLGLALGGLLIVPRLVRYVCKLNNADVLAVVSIGICFSFAYLAEAFHFSVALGAFVAGVVVSESGEGQRIEHSIQPIRDVFAAIFFVSVGMQVDPAQAWAALPVALLVFVAVVLAQVASVTVGGLLSGVGLRRALTSGLALGQIGEFSFIIAGIGAATSVIPPSLQAILVTVAVLTAFTTPLLLRHAGSIVKAFEKVIPSRIHHLLGIYERWSDKPRLENEGPKWRHAVRLMAIDGIGLVVLIGLSARGFKPAVAALKEQLPLGPVATSVLFWFTVGLLALPLIWGLARNAAALADDAASAIATMDDREERSPWLALRQAFKTVVYIAVALAVGLPASALLAPVGGSWPVVVLMGIGAVAFSVGLWRSSGRMDRELQSNAASLFRSLLPAIAPQQDRDHSSAATGEEPRTSLLLPGLKHVTPHEVSQGTVAIGATLATLNLRVLTGASVVAIRRGAEGLLLPTGRENLREGDVLALTGEPEAVAAAVELLNGRTS